MTGQVYAERLVEYEYDVVEEEIKDYRTKIEGTAETGFTITNTHTPILIDIDGTKTWNDANDQDGIRPETITVNLLADGKVVRTITVAAPAAEAGETGEPAETNEWTYTFTGLPKYRDHGILIKYTVEEILPEGYEANYTGTDIANKHVPELIDIPVRKVWDDLNDRHGFRPETITIHLFADGVEVPDSAVTVTAGEDGNWEYTYVGLDKYRDHGTLIIYTVTEEVVERYTTTIETENGVIVITNKYRPGEPPTPPPPPEPPVPPVPPVPPPVPPIPPEEEEFEDDNDVPLAGYEEELEEPEVPLSPFTGDDRHTNVWAGVSMISLVGIVVLARRRKEEEDE